MAELRLTMTAEARNVLTDLLRLIAPAAARVSVNRAKIPNSDAEVAAFWTETLSSQAAEEARLLATAFANAKGEPAVILLKNDGQAFAFLRALSAVRIALPQASPALYLTSSLAITFPFNIVLGIPLYHAFTKFLFSL